MARALFILLPFLLGNLTRWVELDFARDVRPVLSDACYHCHGPDAKVRKAKLRLHDREGEQTGALANALV